MPLYGRGTDKRTYTKSPFKGVYCAVIIGFQNSPALVKIPFYISYCTKRTKTSKRTICCTGQNSLIFQQNWDIIFFLGIFSQITPK